ncbi:MAG: hypothetical protein ACRD1B_11285, partial [Thermoanaerobaculia bacterium]
QNVRFASDEQTLSWNTEPKSSLYDILWGDAAELRADGGFSRSSCRAWRVVPTSFVETNVPAPGQARYYLVRGKKDRCKLGTWGSALRDQARLTCP